MTVETIILGGGNRPGTAEALRMATSLLEARVGSVIAVSGRHESDAWGFDADRFSNVAWKVSTTLSPSELLACLQQMERDLGRDRSAEEREKAAEGQRYASRVIDLDILLYGREHIVTPELEVPHRLLLERPFAMLPLEDVTGWSEEEAVSKINEIRNGK